MDYLLTRAIARCVAMLLGTRDADGNQIYFVNKLHTFLSISFLMLFVHTAWAALAPTSAAHARGTMDVRKHQENINSIFKLSIFLFLFSFSLSLSVLVSVEWIPCQHHFPSCTSAYTLYECGSSKMTNLIIKCIFKWSQRNTRFNHYWPDIIISVFWIISMAETLDRGHDTFNPIH